MKIGLNQLINSDLDNSHSKTIQNYKLRSVQQPDLTTLEGLMHARKLRLASSKLTDRKAERPVIKIDNRKIPVRIINPKKNKPNGLFINIPGGGFYLNEAPRNDKLNADYADELSMSVVSIEYRLAPEHPWPAATNDCLAATLWLIEYAKDRFGSSKILIGGMSAGANLAMTTLLRLRTSNDLNKIGGVILQYGVFDLSGLTPGGKLFKNEHFIKMYTPKQVDKTLPDISPLYGDLNDLPPVHMLVGTNDILMEDNFAMAARLAASGNKLDFNVYPNAAHGFTGHANKIANTANHNLTMWAKQQLKH